MPIRKVTSASGRTGYQWGYTGKVYPTRQQALQQARAIKASQSKEKKK
jgi:hypothetical protein